jgi:hypothetical protein
MLNQAVALSEQRFKDLEPVVRRLDSANHQGPVVQKLVNFNPGLALTLD